MEEHTTNNGFLPRRVRREKSLQKAAEIIETHEDPMAALIQLVGTLERHDVEKIFEQFEDPYSDFNIGREYTGTYWEAWKAVI
nr:hypothetical protein [Amylibacter sp.]